MSININEISPKLVLVNPASEIEGNELIPIASLPAYDTTKSLTENKPTFVRRVHARLFLAKIQSSQYVPNFTSMTLNYEGGNKRETETMDTLSQDSLNEAFIISDEITKWFNAVKKKIHVNINHVHGESGVVPLESDVTIGGTGDELGLKF